jgi:rod shape determining protein RodA
MESRQAKDAVKPSSRYLDSWSGGSDGGDIIVKKPVLTWSLIAIFVILVSFGAVNLYSASGGDSLFYTHIKHMVVAITAFLIVALFIKPSHLKSSTYWSYGVICFLLVSVLVMGQIGGGSRRWLTIGPINGQPSELAKIVVAMVAARFFSEVKLNRAYRLRDLWVLLAMVGAMSVLIFPQPDLGTGSFLVLIVAAQICFININWRSVAIIAGSAAVAIPLAWQFLLLPYQRTRVLSFMNPSLDTQGKGYNVLQSLVAIGSGGTYGKGFMNGTQTHLKFLPMSHSDFIFSVFAEEHGFLGGSIILLSFALVAYIALLIAKQAKSTFSSLLAIGLAAFLFIEFAINVAMVLRMFPVKGLPLPFFSFGGSNLITACIAIGILIAIDKDNRSKFKAKSWQMMKS